MKQPIKINIACGDSYLDDWLNFDYVSLSAHVTRANLLGRLPLDANMADVVYSSHFLEHIPRTKVYGFLSECFRITRSGGRLRLVLPDFEELCSAYLEYRRSEDHDKANFLQMEILDQCVRQKTGGELGEYYTALETANSGGREMLEFVRLRTGYDLHRKSKPAGSRWSRLLSNPGILFNKLEKIYIKLLSGLMPPAFRQQNVSFTEVGERHTWVYDYYSVKKLLIRAGFIDVQRMSATTSNILDFPFYPLDLYEDAVPRKGAESMYIEAVKP